MLRAVVPGILALGMLVNATNAQETTTAAGAKTAAEPTVINLWPGQAPGENGPLAGAEGDQPANPKDKKTIIRRMNVSVPTLTVYPAPADKATGASVIIAPGGGYSILAWDLEGTEVAEWLNGLGVTAFVLKYRVPKRADDPTSKLPFMDAQRAIRIVRSRAAEWKLDPARVGMLGFSAGGNLTAKTAVHPEVTSYEPLDEMDKASARPDFAVLVYPAWLEDKKEPTKPAEGFAVDAQAPPMILIHAADDPINCQASIVTFQGLRAAKVPAELHVFASGGHGYGLRPSDHPVTKWPDRVGDWMTARGLLKNK